MKHESPLFPVPVSLWRVLYLTLLYHSFENKFWDARLRVRRVVSYQDCPLVDGVQSTI